MEAVLIHSVKQEEINSSELHVMELED